MRPGQQGCCVVGASAPRQCLCTSAGDPWRDLLLELLQAGKAVKRADIFAAAQKKSMTLSDNTYTRTVTKALKDLCDSKSGSWTLKLAA